MARPREDLVWRELFAEPQPCRSRQAGEGMHGNSLPARAKHSTPAAAPSFFLATSVNINIKLNVKFALPKLCACCVDAASCNGLALVAAKAALQALRSIGAGCAADAVQWQQQQLSPCQCGMASLAGPWHSRHMASCAGAACSSIEARVMGKQLELACSLTHRRPCRRGWMLPTEN